MKSHVQSAPRVVTTGGNNSAHSHSPQSAHVDWLGFTVNFSDTHSLHWLAQSLRQFIPRLVLTPTGKGWFGYKVRHTIALADLPDLDLGLVAHGGDSQRGTATIQLNAQACALITDWAGLKAWCEQNAVRITRVDLAHDDLTGQVLSIERALQWRLDGLFSKNGAREGRTAVKARLVDDLGSSDGKTFYVGKRGSGKLLRIYEKGKQLGDMSSPWVRAEVELRSKDRVIPWDVLDYPADYLSDCYPCLQYLSAEQRKIKTIKKSIEITLDSSVHHLSYMGGMLVNFLMLVFEGDAQAVVKLIRRDGIPRRLSGFAAHLPQYISGGTHEDT